MINKYSIKVLLLFSFIFSYLQGYSQQVNYKELFGEDWKKAEAFENENRNQIEPVLRKNKISYPEAIAIIFPELIRYSALREKMEISLLKTLYVNLGEEYADFSIGAFQMKPSFAETVRDESTAYLGRRSGIVFKSSSDYENIKEFRKSILRDLENTESQVIYLISFIRICEKKFNMSRFNALSRVKFLASAYNFSFDKTAIQIEKMADKKFFSTSLFKSETYSYADISLFWFKHFNSNK